MNRLFQFHFVRKLYYVFLKRTYGKDTALKFASEWTDYSNFKYGPQALSIVKDTIQETNGNWWLSWGSILAYYREHGFIKGDNDIDIGMFGKDISVEFVNGLIRKGFRFSCAIVDKDYKAFHLTFNYKGVKLDFYSYYLEGNHIVGFAPRPNGGSWSKSFRQKKFAKKWGFFPYKGFKEVEFVGVKTTVFQNDKEILQMMYGDDFMTPIPGKKSGPSKYIKIVEASDEDYAFPCNFKEFVELKDKHLI